MKSVAPKLTERQSEIVRLISLGCTNEEIACILDLSPATVDNHRARAMKSLGTDKAALVTRLAIKMRITSMKDQLTRSEKRKSGRRNDGWN
jgi:DNA-binding NarL/FixJ family response regulator